MPFVTVVDYCHYRLSKATDHPTADDLRHIPRIKSQLEGLQPILEPFTVSEPVKLLRFLAIFTSSFRALDRSESMPGRVSAYLLSNNAKDTYDARRHVALFPENATGQRATPVALYSTWANVKMYLLGNYTNYWSSASNGTETRPRKDHRDSRGLDRTQTALPAVTS